MNGSRAEDHDLIVVGGGIFGLSTAWEAARRGEHVVLIDRSPLPAAAASSTGPSRKFRTTYDSLAYSQLAVAARSGWDRIQRDADEIIFLPLGNLVYTVEESHPTLDLFQSMSERAGGSIERLDQAALRARFPHFRLARTGIFEHDAGVLRATAATNAVARLARRAGVEILEATPVARLDLASALPAAILDNGRRLAASRMVVAAGGDPRHRLAMAASRMVVAAGAWSAGLIPELRPLITLKEQGLAYLTGLPASFDATSFPPFSELETIFYGFPRLGDDPVKIGWHAYGEVTTNPDADRDRASGTFLDGVVGFLASHLGLDVPRSTIAGATCLYDLTPTSDFIADFIPGSTTTLVATGGSGHAFKFGSIIGQVVMDRLDGVAGSWTPAFAWPPGGRGQSGSARSGRG